MGNYINSDGLRYLYQKLKSIFVKNDDPRLTDSRNANDVYAWAKEPSITAALGYAPARDTDVQMIKKKNQELEENLNAIHKVYKGTSDPTTNLGKDGDIYFQIEA